MKHPLLLSLTSLTLVALTATTLYAQSATISSVITKMKAVAANFTLTELIPSGQTGLTSAPLVGKKTGDILTAAEYNRLLEVVAQGGGGSNNGNAKWVVFDGTSCPSGICVIKSHSGVSQVKRVSEGVYRVTWQSPMPSVNYLTMAHGSRFTWSSSGDAADCDTSWATKTVNDWAFCQVNWYMQYRDSSDISVMAISSGWLWGNSNWSDWIDVPLTDTNPFDTACEYKFKMNNAGWFGLNEWEYWSYINAVWSDNIVYIGHSWVVSHINADSKNSFRVNGTPYYTVLAMKKLCGGSGGSSGGISSTPDYESDWKTVTAWQQFSIVHNLSTSRPFKLQTIVRESATKDDEVIHEWFEACVDLSDGQNGGMYFWIDKSDNPENQIKVQSGRDFPCYFHGKIPPGGSTMNWSSYYPSSVQMKVRIWK